MVFQFGQDWILVKFNLQSLITFKTAAKLRVYGPVQILSMLC
jgi:hypothetical protein